MTPALPTNPTAQQTIEPDDFSLPVEALSRLFCSNAIHYSYSFNPRLTEDVTHAAWNVVVNLWRNNRPLLFPTPQLYIYKTKQQQLEEDDPNASLDTVADSTSQGVVVDYCILMPAITWYQGQAPTDEELKAINLDFLSLGYVSSLCAPLLVELKRPVTRSADNILEYIADLGCKIGSAGQQVLLQSQCLFSSAKYADQQWAILVAGAGGWWMCKIVTQQDIEHMFDISEYGDLLKQLKREDIISRETEERKDKKRKGTAKVADPDELFTPAEVLSMKSAMKSCTDYFTNEATLEKDKVHPGYFTQQAREAQAKKRAQSDKARDIRCASRADRKQDRLAACVALETYMQDLGSKRFYSEEEVKWALKLRNGCHNHKPSALGKKVWADAQSVKIPVDDPTEFPWDQVRNRLRSDWTPPMRIASPVSNRYFAVIRKLLTEDPTAPLNLTVT
ncbi:hypothetical protein CC1G_07264 [Coprinopsis cinerea okayama7|uniref:Uncharacterized protein n=1 Tax=Coprinopsis cinerea (strain Okayama-7 / 130 / ATCC MYA-4618 / FGSC 9003) TaxID=240176 RepID=A8PD52_COPC7|nr:hypothetical protein CC1G_07264 [Coprinopsis cinerea okayama7\|eukprot:XP_001840534.1 hypothetical protein CC1G_07264 [Coprinopsis cinerea okayama7\